MSLYAFNQHLSGMSAKMLTPDYGKIHKAIKKLANIAQLFAPGAPVDELWEEYCILE